MNPTISSNHHSHAPPGNFTNDDHYDCIHQQSPAMHPPVTTPKGMRISPIRPNRQRDDICIIILGGSRRSSC